MGLLGSPFSRLLGLASILALYAAATGSFLSSAALSSTAARALYLLALCLFIGASVLALLPAWAAPRTVCVLLLGKQHTCAHKSSRALCRSRRLDHLRVWAGAGGAVAHRDCFRFFTTSSCLGWEACLELPLLMYEVFMRRQTAGCLRAPCTALLTLRARAGRL